MKILLCCGGGFSSSYLANKVQNEIDDMGKGDEVSITFLPFDNGCEVMDEYDVMICCPHLDIYVKKLTQENKDLPIPIYVLPPKIYGNLQAKDIIPDCEDVIEMFKAGMPNPIHFEGEERVLRIRRDCSYREYVQKKA